jgi:hypothetical protein
MCRPKRAVGTSIRAGDLRRQSLTLGGAGAAACFIKLGVALPGRVRSASQKQSVSVATTRQSDGPDVGCDERSRLAL